MILNHEVLVVGSFGSFITMICFAKWKISFRWFSVCWMLAKVSSVIQISRGVAEICRGRFIQVGKGHVLSFAFFDSLFWRLHYFLICLSMRSFEFARFIENETNGIKSCPLKWVKGIKKKYKLQYTHFAWSFIHMRITRWQKLVRLLQYSCWAVKLSYCSISNTSRCLHFVLL